MARLSLKDIRGLAAEIAREESSEIEVVAAQNAEGAADYTEVILTLRGCAVEPCQVVIGISRTSPETTIRRVLRDGLRKHLRSHR